MSLDVKSSKVSLLLDAWLQQFSCDSTSWYGGMVKTVAKGFFFAGCCDRVFKSGQGCVSMHPSRMAKGEKSIDE